MKNRRGQTANCAILAILLQQEIAELQALLKRGEIEAWRNWVKPAILRFSHPLRGRGGRAIIDEVLGISGRWPGQDENPVFNRLAGSLRGADESAPACLRTLKACDS